MTPCVALASYAMKQSEKSGLIARTKDFIVATLAGDFDQTKNFQRRLQAILEFFITAVKKFLQDEVLLRSASISYAVVVSFVPTLVVVMMLGSRFINIEEYFGRIDDMARLSGMQLDLQPYFKVIRDLLKNAGAIGGVGLLVMMFSATSVLRNVDDAINRIWRVGRQRPLVQKIAGFMMVIVFGPIVLGIGISSAQWVVQQFASPSIEQVKVVGETVRILGNQHLYLVQNERGKPFREKNILGLTDYQADNTAIVYNQNENSLVPLDRKDVYDHAPTATRKVLRDAVFTDFVSVGKREFITTGNGILAVSRDGGQTYHLRQFYRQRRDANQEARFNRIQFFNERNGIIIGDEGLILRTTDAGDTWQPTFQDGVTKRLREIRPLKPGTWVILGEESTALITEDAGATFRPYTELIRAVHSSEVVFTGLAMSPRAGFAVGEGGVLLVTRDGGVSWKLTQMNQTMFFEDVAVAPDGTAVAVGLDGLIRYSQYLPDGSIQWLAGKADSGVDLHAVRYYAKERRFIIGGDHYHMLSHQLTSGIHTGPREFTVIQKAPFWRRLVSAAGNIIIPFLVIFLMFFTLYKLIPYTSVAAASAATGAAFTSVAWVIFLVGYKIYITSFAKGTAALYGTLALVPLTLLLLYVSSLIMLFGAQLAYFKQNPQFTRRRKTSVENEQYKYRLWHGLLIMQKLAQSFNSGKGDTSTNALVKFCDGDSEEFTHIIERLKNRGFVSQIEEQKWVLAVNPSLIEVGDIVEDLDFSDYTIPEYNSKNAFMAAAKPYFELLESGRSKVFRKVKLAALLGE